MFIFSVDNLFLLRWLVNPLSYPLAVKRAEESRVATPLDVFVMWRGVSGTRGIHQPAPFVFVHTPYFSPCPRLIGSFHSFVAYRHILSSFRSGKYRHNQRALRRLLPPLFCRFRYNSRNN